MTEAENFDDASKDFTSEITARLSDFILLRRLAGEVCPTALAGVIIMERELRFPGEPTAALLIPS